MQPHKQPQQPKQTKLWTKDYHVRKELKNSEDDFTKAE